eukprot:TRINITY_DN1820_c0_g1_i1.p1 TRINITY_DN1820_c0_g1~~TRINITY_DN1820_c0_g1_i1.p1  ORF type:complete len:325 (+),score=77.68 TRINITY_DN1820_c0_g1_i1:157-1131(+)
MMLNLLNATFYLFIAYLLLGCFIGLQLGRIVYYRHKLKSFQVAFLLLCFSWALLRTIYFLFIYELTGLLAIFIYWLPINIMFATFSLLVVFYAHLHQRQKSEWRAWKRKYLIVWGVLSLLFLAFGLTLILLGINDQMGNSLWLMRVHYYFNGLVFLVVVSFLAWHCGRVWLLMRASEGAQTMMVARVSFPKILTVTASLFLLFASRCVYNLYCAVAAFAISIPAVTLQDNLVVAGLFVAWEILPTVLVLVLFGKVEATNIGYFSRGTEYSRPPMSYSLPHTTQARRYDFSESVPLRYAAQQHTYAPFGGSYGAGSLNNAPLGSL